MLSKRPVVLVHGMFVTPLCWEKWQPYLGERGFRAVHAPAWPEHDAPVDEQRRRHPHAALGALTLADVVEHHRELVRALDPAPILVGHSMGGLVVQLLLQEGLGAAGVAIDSAPPKGLISLKWSFLRSNWAAIDPFADADEPVALTFEQFAYAFVNTLPPDAQRAAYERHCVPESRRVGKGPTTDVATVDFARPRPPLLLIGGAEDHIIPCSLNHTNYEKYAATKSNQTAFRDFPGRSHWIIADDGWREVADHALDWLATALA